MSGDIAFAVYTYMCILFFWNIDEAILFDL
jgi:hypothetical protein